MARKTLLIAVLGLVASCQPQVAQKPNTDDDSDTSGNNYYYYYGNPDPVWVGPGIYWGIWIGSEGEYWNHYHHHHGGGHHHHDHHGGGGHHRGGHR